MKNFILFTIFLFLPFSYAEAKKDKKEANRKVAAVIHGTYYNCFVGVYSVGNFNESTNQPIDANKNYGFEKKLISEYTTENLLTFKGFTFQIKRLNKKEFRTSIRHESGSISTTDFTMEKPISLSHVIAEDEIVGAIHCEKE